MARCSGHSDGGFSAQPCSALDWAISHSMVCATALSRSSWRLDATFAKSPRAGHKSVAFTLTRYGGLFDEGTERAVDRLDALLSDPHDASTGAHKRDDRRLG